MKRLIAFGVALFGLVAWIAIATHQPPQDAVAASNVRVQPYTTVWCYTHVDSVAWNSGYQTPTEDLRGFTYTINTEAGETNGDTVRVTLVMTSGDSVVINHAPMVAGSFTRDFPNVRIDKIRVQNIEVGTNVTEVSICGWY